MTMQPGSLCDVDSGSLAWVGLVGFSPDDGPDDTSPLPPASVVAPFRIASQLCIFFMLLTFVVSTISKNYSQVDKLWSISPILYAWMAVSDRRTFLAAILVSIWGIRLTWNFHRRGGYRWPPWCGDEDYRWNIIRTGGFLKILSHPMAWILFNFGFISVCQNVVLLLLVAPSFVAQAMAISCHDNDGHPPLNYVDGIATILFLSFLTVETIADNQQQSFQREKKKKMRMQKEGEGPKHHHDELTGEYADGFRQSGLFGIVRKPNYAAEQGLWISFHLFSVSSGAPYMNWSAMGWIILVLLFALSGWFTEKISRSKYERYDDYIRRVPLYIPNIFTLVSRLVLMIRPKRTEKSC